MFRESALKALSLLVIVALSATPVLNSANAAIISTEDALAADVRQAQINNVQTLLAEKNVREALMRFGVEPEMAAARVEALSDAELARLEGRLGDLPAGGTGVIEVIGIVAVVLIILELLGVTDVFKKL